MKYAFQEIANIIGGVILTQGNKNSLTNIIYDTRRASFPNHSLFVALQGEKRDGHTFIQDAIDIGILTFIISKKTNTVFPKNANVLLVDNTLKAIQNLAVHHRSSFDIPVIGITGSNGKTIVKEWLYLALQKKYNVVKSPNSFNSQLGVALSILQIEEKHQIGIFEAGISQTNEMSSLQKMIKPSIGILTNIGDAHSMGFNSKQDKLLEKSILFKEVKSLIFNEDSPLISSCLEKLFNKQLFPWSYNESKNITFSSYKKGDQKAIKAKSNNTFFEVNIKQENVYYEENISHLIACLILLDFSPSEISQAISDINPLPNRLEIKKGINNCTLINDSYSIDMASMKLALEYQEQHLSKNKSVIFTAFEQQDHLESTYLELAQLLKAKKINSIFAIGIKENHKALFDLDEIMFYSNFNELKSSIDFINLKNCSVLLKGSRKHKLEKIYEHLSKIVHGTTLETNFSAVENNINVYKSLLKKDTKMMAVIKADAYGSGSKEMSIVLEKNKIDYLAVAIIDEGVKIRESGCHLPIMILNVGLNNINKLWEFNLEPEVYSIELLKEIAIQSSKANKSLNIHIKLDSGMHRLGFEEDQIQELLQCLSNNKHLNVKSVFSHLSATDKAQFDSFTINQIQTFEKAYDLITESLGYRPLKHILNTSGIVRFKDFQFNMVRIGLGLYGIDETKKIQGNLQRVHSLKTTVLQIKKLKKGETTGYNRSGKAHDDIIIAVLGIGYADGILRHLGNGNFSIAINEKICPTIGNICMDVMMVNISNAGHVYPGQEVEIFGENIHIETMAQKANTISYEIISRLSERIKRVYTYD